MKPQSKPFIVEIRSTRRARPKDKSIWGADGFKSFVETNCSSVIPDGLTGLDLDMPFAGRHRGSVTDVRTRQ